MKNCNDIQKIDAIILAGGLGTRLQAVINEIPKPMAPINEIPFLAYLLDFLALQKIKKAVLSVGYKNEAIREYFGNSYKDINLTYSVEKEPLGTGGAVKKAFFLLEGEEAFILNGDTFFNVDLLQFYQSHKAKKADLSIALKPLNDYDRYGTVCIDENSKITGFEEKMQKDLGLINGGIYIASKNRIINHPAEKFSFEKDWLEKNYKTSNFYGTIFDEYFIDIGIPEDYEKARQSLPAVLYNAKINTDL